jgi:hypothetical protein
MSYKTAQIKGEDFGLLSPNLRKEINNLKDYTEGYNTEFFDIFKDNDKRLFALAEKELKNLATAKAAQDVVEKAKLVAKAKPATKPDTKKTPAKPAAKKTPAKPRAPRKLRTPAKAKAATKPVAKKEYVHSWKQRISDEAFETADKVDLTCSFRVLTATKSGEVEVKTTFNTGDRLLVHEDGYPFAVMTKGAFEKRCTQVKKESTPISKKEPKAKQPKTPEVIQAILDNPSVPMLTWLDGEIELWKNRQSNKKVTKIMAIKETGDIVIEYTHYDKLLRVADLRYTYHTVCPETAKLKKVAEPKRGSYRLLVTTKALKEQYSTNRNWEECQLWIREAYQCSRAGNCSPKQKELFSLFYKQCGDKRVKEENIAYLRWLHKKAGESWKRGEESYLGAFARVKKELKTEQA